MVLINEVKLIFPNNTPPLGKLSEDRDGLYRLWLDGKPTEYFAFIDGGRLYVITEGWRLTLNVCEFWNNKGDWETLPKGTTLSFKLTVS